jgi:hypothetical protein
MLVRANEWRRRVNITAIALRVVAAMALFASAGQSTASSKLPSRGDSNTITLAKGAVEEISARNYKNSFGYVASPM